MITFGTLLSSSIFYWLLIEARRRFMIPCLLSNRSTIIINNWDIDLTLTNYKPAWYFNNCTTVSDPFISNHVNTFLRCIPKANTLMGREFFNLSIEVFCEVFRGQCRLVGELTRISTLNYDPGWDFEFT